MEKKKKKNLRVTFAAEPAKEGNEDASVEGLPVLPVSSSGSGKGPLREEVVKPPNNTRSTDNALQPSRSYVTENSTVFEALAADHPVSAGKLNKSRLDSVSVESLENPARRRLRKRYEKNRSEDSTGSSISELRSPSRLASNSHHTIKTASRLVALILWGAMTTFIAMAIARWSQPRPAPVLLVKVVRSDAERLPLETSPPGSDGSSQVRDKDIHGDSRISSSGTQPRREDSYSDGGARQRYSWGSKGPSSSLPKNGGTNR